MRVRTSFLLLILGLTSRFTYGFSLKPNSHKPLINIVDRHQIQKINDYYHHISMSAKPISIRTSPIAMRGGSAKASAVSGTDGDAPSQTLTNKVASLWAASGVVMILGKSIKRILPIAMEPFNGVATPLSNFQLIAYVGMCLWFAYVEGYKGFQLKFSPLVVSRAQTLKPFSKGSPIHHTLLGPFYAMGLFHATKKRKIVSWSVSIGVGAIVAAVKRLPYPWRNIVDAGVIVGLTWGSMSIAVEWIKVAVLGIETKMDPALPQS